MASAPDAADAALAEVDRLRKALGRSATAQVRNADEKALARATSLAWFNNHREPVAQRLGVDAMAEIDQRFRNLLETTERAAARTTYLELLAELRRQLVSARSDALTPVPAAAGSSDAAPSFAGLVSSSEMQAVLTRRWNECVTCLTSGAALAATVMMGGLLEGLLLAKVNSFSDKRRMFTAPHAPKDRAGKTLPLSDWTLKNYIDVAHDLGWISRSARDVGEVLRDYRNYVHPQKELSHGIQLSTQDATVWWEVSKTIARELL